METEASFVTEPAFVHGDIAAADGAVNRSFRRGDARNTAAQRSSRVIDAQVATGAASAATESVSSETTTGL
jgi:hypothetical protein